jgi:hypothetical protein
MVIGLPAPAFVPVFEFIRTNPMVTFELAPASVTGNESPISANTNDVITNDFLDILFIDSFIFGKSIIARLR